MTRSKAVCGIAAALALLLSGAARAAEEPPLDNAEVVKLTKLDLGDEIVIAKIRAAKAVNFSLTAEDLAALKQAGVGRDVMKAMLDRTAAPAAAAAVPAAVQVVLKAREGATTLSPVYGSLSVGWGYGIEFQEVAAAVRTRDRRPSIQLASASDPRSVWWLVKLDPDDDEDEMNRSIGMEPLPGAVFVATDHAVTFSQSMPRTPDSDDTIPYEAVQEAPGSWTLTPHRNLRPGEYGMFVMAGEKATLYDFGVDK